MKDIRKKAPHPNAVTMASIFGEVLADALAQVGITEPTDELLIDFMENDWGGIERTYSAMNEVLAKGHARLKEKRV